MILWFGSDGSDRQKAKLWISSPPGAPPREYQPVVFKMNGTFSPVFMRFSPDGRQVVLSMYRSSGGQMWVLPFPDGSGAHGKARRILASQLSSSEAPQASWMPDSRRIVMAHARASRRQLWIADTVKETIEPLTADEVTKNDPSVSPDGKRILFTSQLMNFDLVEIPVSGSDPVRPLLTTNRDETYPAWSPRGSSLPT